MGGKLKKFSACLRFTAKIQINADHRHIKNRWLFFCPFTFETVRLTLHLKHCKSQILSTKRRIP